MKKINISREVRTRIGFYVGLISLFAMTSCSLTRSPLNPDTVVDKVGCESYQYSVIKELNQWLSNQGSDVVISESAAELSVRSFQQDWLPRLEENPRYQELSKSKRDQLKQIIYSYLNYLVKVSPQDPQERRQFLAAIALGDESDAQKIEIQRQLKTYQDQMAEIIPLESPSTCNSEEEPLVPQPSQKAQQQLEKSMKRLVATTYQTCDVLNLKPVHDYDDLVKGIKVIGQHPGGGQKREIASVADVSKSHYYIRGQSYGSSCFAVNKNPLIYDFGGRPAYSTGSKEKLNFFKDNGSGTKVLGYDCSALVYAVLMNAGLKMSTSLPFHADDIDGAYSGHFLKPSSKQNCIEPVHVSKSSTVIAGDIIAMSGHVLMIYKTQADPLGIDRIQTRAQCESVQVKDFNFEVLQSSASKGGVGVNIYDAADYIASVNALRKGFLDLAKQACFAKFDGKSYKIGSDSFSLMRHKKTPACQSSVIAFEKSSCVESCLQ